MEVTVVPVSNAVQRSGVLLWIIWIISIFWERSTGAERCRANRLPPGVTITGACSFRERESCRARCERNGTTLWNKPVSCLPNGRWSTTPLCRTTSRVTSMEVVDCRKIPLQVPPRGGTTVCLKITETSQRPKCPELLNVTTTLGNCSREAGTTCRVLCGGGVGPTTLRCLPDGRWSSVPGCVSLKPITCPEPGIVKLINCSRTEGETCKWTENCDSKMPGETCIVECRDHYVFFSFLTKAFPLTCNPDLTWIQLPPCICLPFVDVPGETIGQQCERLTPDQLCQVLCVRVNQFVPVRCAPNGVWEAPQCPQARFGRNIIPDSIHRSPLRRFLSRTKRHCNRPRELPFRSSCLHLSEALEGYRATTACRTFLRMRRRAPPRTLASWFLEQRTPCVWADDSVKESGQYCEAMLLAIQYESVVVQCDAFRCPFVCEEKRYQATS